MLIPKYGTRYTLSRDGKIYDEVRLRYVPTHVRKQYIWASLIDTTGKSHSVVVGRLLAQAFIPNPNNYRLVRYKDNNGTNISLDNLYWCSDKDRAKGPRKSTRGRTWQRTHTDADVEFVYTFLSVQDKPMSMRELSIAASIPYSVARYSLYDLINEHKVEHVDGGYVVCSKK